jgi:endoglucanase
MKNTFLLVFSFVFLLQVVKGQGYLRANGKMITDASGKEIILRGMGLGGWMLQEPYMLQLSGVAGTQHEIRKKIENVIGKERTTTFYDAWLANHCRKADIDSLAAWGFNSVRLPMHYNLFTLPIEQEPVQGKNTWLTKGFTMVDSLLSWCGSNHIYLILDLHAAPGGQGHDNAIADRDTSKPSLWESEANKQKTIALWRELATRYSNSEWIGGYDLINETNWGFEDAKDKNGCAEKGNEPLKKLLSDITTAIREVDKNHIVFIEANCWANNYGGMFPLWDKNMAVSFHKYWNYNDQTSIQNFIKIREEQNVPIWLGESGENSNVWFTDAIELLERNKIGWAWWPLKKLGFNNPLQIRPNQGYDKLLSYWKGKAAKPSPEEAYNALMQLTEDIKAENTIIHKDVVDAMFRQTHSTETVPFKNHITQANSIVFATDYDLGRNGYAYYDNDTADYHVSTGKNTPGNKGRAYRNDGVDIEPCLDVTTNGYNVSSFEKGEWLQYSLTVPASGTYDITVRYKTGSPNAAINLIQNARPLTKSISLSNANNDTSWTTTEVKNVYLNKGVNKLRVYAEEGEFALNYLKFTSSERTNVSSLNKSKGTQ